MLRRPDRLEEVVWPDPKPVEKRNLTATKRAGAWLIFLGPFLMFMIFGLIIVAIIPARFENKPAAFPLVLLASGIGAYFVLRKTLASSSMQPARNASKS